MNEKERRSEKSNRKCGEGLTNESAIRIEDRMKNKEKVKEKQ